MNEPDNELCLVLHSVPGLSDAKLLALLRHFGSPAAVLAADRSAWALAGVESAVCSALEVARRRNGHPAGTCVPHTPGYANGSVVMETTGAMR